MHTPPLPTKMTAWHFNTASDLSQPTLESCAMPVLKPGEALIRVQYASINHRDLWISQRAYPGLTNAILGSDCYGEVVQLHGDTRTAAAAEWLGKSVIVNPMIQYPTEILGMPRNGTFAEYLAIPVDRLHLPPAHLAPHEAGAIGLCGLTAMRILHKAALQPTDTILITGIGGAVAQFCLLMLRDHAGAVAITSSDDQKCQAVVQRAERSVPRSLHCMNYRDPHWHRDLLRQMGPVDYIIDGAGAALPALLELLNHGGALISYGATAKAQQGQSEGPLPLRSIFAKERRILGVMMGSDSDFMRMLDTITTQKIRPIIDSVVGYTGLPAALEKIREGAHCGKIVLRWDH